MSLPPDTERSAAIRAALKDHISTRLSAALAKITGTDAASEKRRKDERAFYDLDELLRSGAECVGQVQLATHIVKGIHPGAKVRKTTNLNIAPALLPMLPLLGSHVLNDQVDIDATGNGAFNKQVFEVSLLLGVSFGTATILDLLKASDVDAISALSNLASGATSIAKKLSEIDGPRSLKVASHGKAKQLYWLAGSDPHDDDGYHLLAPLYPTSLVHRVYQALLDDRSSDAAKAARDARKAGRWHERPVREYPYMAIQKLGGTKPQNISQLNSERRGENCLLASLPPNWQSPEVRPVWGAESLFLGFRWRPGVRTHVADLRRFLESDPASNRASREHRDELVEAMLDELMQFTAELHTLEPGWSNDARCDLPDTHKAWLDPDGFEPVVNDLVYALAHDFANWLNHLLRTPLPMGDAEYLHWRKQARELFKEWAREGFHEFS